MTPTPPPVPAAKGSLGKWLGGHKWEAALGAGGIGATVFLALRAKKNAAAGATSTTSSTGASSALPSSYYPPTDGGGSGFAEELSPILAQLTSELGTANAGNAVTAQYGSLSGSGYLPSGDTEVSQVAPGQTSTSNAGDLYDWVSPSQAGALGYNNLYAEITPGNFTQIANLPGGTSNLQSGTALYTPAKT